MTPQQTALVQQILAIVGMVFTTLGWTTPTEVATWTTTIMQAIGPASALFGLVWTTISHRKASIISSAATLTDANGVKIVKNVTLNAASVDANAVAAATPSNVNVPMPPQSTPPVTGL